MKTKFNNGFDKETPAKENNWSLNSQYGDNNYHPILRYAECLETTLPNVPFTITRYIYQEAEDGAILEMVKVSAPKSVTREELLKLKEEIQDLDDEEIFNTKTLSARGGSIIPWDITILSLLEL